MGIKNTILLLTKDLFKKQLIISFERQAGIQSEHTIMHGIHDFMRHGIQYLHKPIHLNVVRVADRFIQSNVQ